MTSAPAVPVTFERAVIDGLPTAVAEALIDSGIALSRAIDLEHVHREAAVQARHAVRGTAFCLASAIDASVADGSAADATATPRVAYAVGYDEDAAALEARLGATWRDALATNRVAVTRSALGLELTAPIVGANGVGGAMTVLADDVDGDARLDEATRVLATIAAQTAAALERAELGRRVAHTQRLDAIGEVASGVAHELRNPLFGISSAAQLLRFRVKDDPVVEKNVGRILREVERLNRMATALLDYGRPAVPRLAPGDPDAVWDAVLDAQRGRMESRSLLAQRTRATPPATCAIDAEQLAQLFAIVIDNAIDAAPEASDLSLASSVLPNGGWRCALRNGGDAMSAESLARAFDLFYTTKPGAPGIGLALAQRIVDAHGGTIAIDSTPDAGTTLTITLPAIAGA